MSDGLASLEVTRQFVADLLDLRMSGSERAAVKKSLQLLDADEKHPSLRVHKMQGIEAGIWTASVTEVLRITFLRLDGGRKRLLTLTRHDDR